jgi:hypothetical protein
MADTLCHDYQEIAMITYQFALATSAPRSRPRHPTAEHYVYLTAWESHKKTILRSSKVWRRAFKNMKLTMMELSETAVDAAYFG